MLYEDDIIEAVCAYLERQGFTITQKLNAKQHGDDIIATGNGNIRTLHIEAKGETSSRTDSPRYGKPFSGFQIQDHVANAFYRAAKMATSGRVGGMALPKNAAHERCVAGIQHALDALDIIVLWVASDRSVTTSRPLIERPNKSLRPTAAGQLGSPPFEAEPIA